MKKFFLIGGFPGKCSKIWSGKLSVFVACWFCNRVQVQVAISISPLLLSIESKKRFSQSRSPSDPYDFFVQPTGRICIQNVDDSYAKVHRSSLDPNQSRQI
ncbi:unnamed protein product [Lactuca virosa]|uniref:Uncharacterized protein n=1 Tax=Lactuca virosa TaxID=75947 RepID=A0AAU9MKU9_9ASTR|nr:unnamed protein product [Lactuca virosa]